MHAASSRIWIGSDGPSVSVCLKEGAGIAQILSAGTGWEHAWLAAGGPAVTPVLPISPDGRPAPWELRRVSRDQVELHCDSGAGLNARHIITADAWGLHLALRLELVGSRPHHGRWGFALRLALPAGAAVQGPLGTRGAERAAGLHSPFAWPRRTWIRCPSGEGLEVRAQRPLACTQPKRQGNQLALQLLAAGKFQSGQVVRAECRLMPTLAAVADCAYGEAVRAPTG